MLLPVDLVTLSGSPELILQFVGILLLVGGSLLYLLPVLPLVSALLDVDAVGFRPLRLLPLQRDRVILDLT